MSSPKRVRIFAGPNGSGKSTLVEVVRELKVNLGIYVNSDEIQVELDRHLFLDFNKYALQLTIEHVKATLRQSSFYDSTVGSELSEGLTEQNNCLYITEKIAKDTKFSSFISDYIRSLLLTSCDKFTFETVMSHSSKLDFIRLAKNGGYRVYLYFVSLEDPILNIARVEARVKQGGHDVPADKIVGRYERTMNYLLDAIRLVDRAYLFDNSSVKLKLFAISQNDEISLVDSNFVPQWFQKYIIDKL
jgi:predicted ABC-type ATPase